MESNQAIDHDLHESSLLHVLKELTEYAEEIKQNNESFKSIILQLQEECECLRQKLEEEKNKAQVQNATHTDCINSLKNRIKALKQQLKSAEEVGRVALEENKRYKLLLDNQGSNEGCVIQKCGRFEIKKRLLECTRCHETFNSPSEMDKSVCCYHPKTPVKSGMSLKMGKVFSGDAAPVLPHTTGYHPAASKGNIPSLVSVPGLRNDLNSFLSQIGKNS